MLPKTAQPVAGYFAAPTWEAVHHPLGLELTRPSGASVFHREARSGGGRGELGSAVLAVAVGDPDMT